MESITEMEPLAPQVARHDLDDLALELATRAAGLANHLPPRVRQSMGDLVRSMNCYYSNLIEGHDTHPRDIERALLHAEYSRNPHKRDLQQEAVAHIEVQRLIDHGHDLQAAPTSLDYIKWLHQEFCRRLPAEMLQVKNPDTGEVERVIPGNLRTGFVQIGNHIPPGPDALPHFLARFDQVFSPMPRFRQIVTLGAAHHRFLWIHPFFDGNGRVARLMSHASLLRSGVGSSLWSVARGLARNVKAYKARLMDADSSRRGDLDGRGQLSEKALIDFCAFFLRVCIDQIEFMESLLEPSELMRRMRLHVEDEVQAKRLPKGSFPLLREALLVGELPRGRAPEVTGYAERMARSVVSELLQKGYLKSESQRGPLHMAFPIDAVERWFPRLYPATT